MLFFTIVIGFDCIKIQLAIAIDITSPSDPQAIIRWEFIEWHLVIAYF